jgi:hypothetical protein
MTDVLSHSIRKLSDSLRPSSVFQFAKSITTRMSPREIGRALLHRFSHSHIEPVSELGAVRASPAVYGEFFETLHKPQNAYLPRLQAFVSSYEVSAMMSTSRTRPNAFASLTGFKH